MMYLNGTQTVQTLFLQQNDDAYKGVDIDDFPRYMNLFATTTPMLTKRSFIEKLLIMETRFDSNLVWEY